MSICFEARCKTIGEVLAAHQGQHDQLWAKMNAQPASDGSLFILEERWATENDPKYNAELFRDMDNQWQAEGFVYIGTFSGIANQLDDFSAELDKVSLSQILWWLKYYQQYGFIPTNAVAVNRFSAAHSRGAYIITHIPDRWDIEQDLLKIFNRIENWLCIRQKTPFLTYFIYRSHPYCISVVRRQQEQYALLKRTEGLDSTLSEQIFPTSSFIDLYKMLPYLTETRGSDRPLGYEWQPLEKDGEIVNFAVHRWIYPDELQIKERPYD